MGGDDLSIKASTDEINTAVTELVTEDFFKKLVAYAVNRLFFKFRIVYNVEKGFKGRMVDDLVSDLFLSFLDEGGRNWYINRFPNFEKQVFSSLDSEISNWVTSLDLSGNDVEIEDADGLLDFESSEYLELYNHCVSELEKFGADVDELLVFECMSKGMQRREIADELKVPPEHVTVVRKRLDRKLTLLRKQLEVSWT